MLYANIYFPEYMHIYTLLDRVCVHTLAAIYTRYITLYMYQCTSEYVYRVRTLVLILIYT
jgi:hypothetical protein